ncbi:isocitrate dehydrogenase domain protein [Mycobacterium xenopi 3993]|nr:isocitrate dehydrogenase domain protein [Mycobacterium xenopi 3993]
MAISGTPEGVSEKELVDVIDDVAHCPAYFQLLVKALLLPGLLDLAHTAVPTHLVLCEKDRVFPPPVQPVLHHLSAPGNQNDHTRGPRHIPMFEAPAESPRSSPTSSRSTAHRSGRSALERLFQVVGDRAEELLAVLPRLFRPMRMARSLVICPPSTVEITTSSSFCAKSMTSGVCPACRGAAARASRRRSRRSDWWSGLALLVLAIVAGDGAVGGFGSHRLAVGRHQHRGHQPQ